MRPIVDRAWAVFHHPATAPVLLVVLAVAHVSLDRFPHWDEGVFLSQASGRDGEFAPPAHLGPSREIGSVWKVGILTSLASDYPNIRMLHILVSVALLAMAAKAMEQAIRVPQAVTVMVLGTYWITFAYLGQLLRFAPLAFVLLLAMARYLLLVSRPSEGPSDPIVLGLLFAVGLLLGPFEAATVLVSTILHWLVFGSPRSTFARMAAAGSVSVVAFGIPFIVETRSRFGSIAARVEALTGLDPVSTSSPGWDLVKDYARLVLLRPVTNQIDSPGGILTRTAFLLAAAIMAVGVYAVVESLIRAARGRAIELHVSYLAITALAIMVFLAGYYSTMADRYFILPGSLALLLGLSRLQRAVRTVIHARLPESDEHRRAAKLAAVVLGVVLFVVPNVAVASQVDANWTHPKEISSVLAVTRSAINDRPCHGVAQFNSPSMQWATGCHVERVSSLPEALDWAQRVEEGAPVFIFWATAAIEPDMAEELTASGWRPLLTPPDGRAPRHQVFIRP